MAKSNNLSKCFHCGNDCEETTVLFREKEFCCQGCKTVYEIIEDNDLGSYYEIENTPGISLKSNTNNSKFDFLDDENTVNQLLDFHENNFAKITLLIPQIHCNSCIWLLENLFKFNDGIKHNKVNFIKRELSLNFDSEKTNLKEIFNLLASLGYTPKVNLSNTEKKKSSKNRKIYYQLGISGFCFGNIMLLSFPEYFSSAETIDPDLKQLFGFLNLGLAIPVLLFGALDYLKSAWSAIKTNVINIDIPISLGIVTIFSVSSIEIITQTGAGYFDSLSGLIFFLLLGRVFQNKTYSQLSFERDYKSYFPIATSKIIDNQEISTPLSKLKKGDQIILRNEDLIPADSILISEKAYIDYSFVTGESEKTRKNTGDLIYAGGKNIGPSITLGIKKEPSQSYLIKLWEEKIQTLADQNNLSNLSNIISKYFTIAIIAIALMSGLYWLTYDVQKAVKAFTSVLIIACPCALALTIPFTLGNTMRIFAKNGFFVKSIQVIENLTLIDHIIFDKTGTLTTPSEGEINYSGKPLDEENKQLIYSSLKNSSHPLSKIICESLNCQKKEIQNFEEHQGKGITATINNTKLKIGSWEFLDVEKPSQTASSVHISINEEYFGYFILENKYRSGLKELISKLKKYSKSILSGDSDNEKKNLATLFGNQTEIRFNQTPFDKLDYVETLLKTKKNVMMLGDGLNDSGALAASTIGIAVTEDTGFFTPASDVIMDAKELTSLSYYLTAAHKAKKLVTIGFCISLLYNVVGLSFAVQGTLSPIISAILMPISSISIVVYATIATNFSLKKFKK